MKSIRKLIYASVLATLGLGAMSSFAQSKVDIEQTAQFAKPGMVAHAASYTTNASDEPNYSTQNTKTFTNMNVGDTWSSYRGDAVKVGIIDSGINYDHEDFMVDGVTKVQGDSKYYSYNSGTSKWLYYGATSHGYSYIDDTLGHGTNVAATVAAAINGVGGLGIAPNVELYVYKVTNSSNGYEFGAIQNALMNAQTLGIKVINMSFQSYENAVSYNTSSMSASTGCSSILTPYLNTAYNAGITLVAAAGNYNTSEPSYPASNNHVISVGSLADGSLTTKAGFSNYGSAIDLVAPGYVNVASNTDNSSYKNTSGTSFSAPLVTGAIALYLQQNPTATPSAIETALYTSCDAIDDSSSSYTNWAGNGSLNISKFLNIGAVPESVTISGSATMSVGSTQTLTAAITPDNATDKSVSWSTSNSNVASIDTNGFVTAIGIGSATITCTTNTGAVTNTFKITVNPVMTSFECSPSEVNLEVDFYQQLTLTGHFSDGSTQIYNTFADFAFESNNVNVCTITDTGLVRATGAGSTTIYMLGPNDTELTINVTVTPAIINPTAIALNGSASINVGESTQLTVAFTPTTTTATGLTWSTNNTDIATVTNGLVTGVAEGDVVITATSTAVNTVSGTFNIHIGALASVENWTLVTSETTLYDNDKIIFGHNKSAFSGARGSNKYLASVEGTADATNITELSTDAIPYTLEKSDTSWKFNSTEGYLAVSGSNLTTNATSANLWNIVIDSNSEAKIQNSSSTSYYLRYNTSSTALSFALYGSTSCSAINLYYARPSSGGYPVVVTPTVHTTGVSLNVTSSSLDLNGTTSVTLTPTIAPSNATNTSVSWSTSAPAVATVNNGVVTAVGKGNATITVTTEDGGYTATCSISVINSAEASVSLDKSTLALQVGQTSTLTATATGGAVTWASDNAAATVSSTGVVTAVSVGSARISATVGSVVAYCDVTVSEAEAATSSQITFKNASSDGSTTISVTTIKNYISEGSNLIKSFNKCTKLYESTTGIKFGSSSASGVLTFTLTDEIAAKTISKITVYGVQYGTDTGTLDLFVNGSATSSSSAAPSAAGTEASINSKVSSITIKTSSNRAYLTSIKLDFAGSTEYTADTFAQDFLDNVTCDSTGATAPNLSKTWSELANLYSSISSETEKAKLINATYTVAGTGASTVVTATGTTTSVVANAMYRYDYIITKYGTTTYTNFVGRTNPLGAANFTINNQSDAVPFVILMSFFVATIGFSFIYIKRKKVTK
jgi:uncharacterized protein YjdB